MTATPDYARNLMAANRPPVMFGAVGYADLMRRHFETAMGLTTAWAAAMTAMSSTVLSSSRTIHAPAGETTGRPKLTVIPGEAGSTPKLQPGPEGPGWLDGAGARPTHHGMLHWLTAAPTLHTDLFDEAMVLLVDEDIKTAS